MLDVLDLSVRYGPVPALDRVSLSVGAGEVVALIGSNGAGKSSLLQAIARTVPWQAGEVQFAGRSLRRCSPHRVVREGIVLVPEGRMIFTTLSVRENLLIGGYTLPGREAVRARLEEILVAFPALRARLDGAASGLSGGERQLLALARGLMARPRLVMLDEPSLGLSPRTAREILRIVAGLRDLGLAVLIVEQNVRQALRIADRGYVLQAGRIVLEGAADGLLAHPLLVDHYLGVATRRGRT